MNKVRRKASRTLDRKITSLDQRLHFGENHLKSLVTEYLSLIKESGITLDTKTIAHLRRLNLLINQVRALAFKDVTMPVEEIRLAAQLAEEAGSDRTQQESVILPLMILAKDPNFHVRRVSLNAIRRIGRFAGFRTVNEKELKALLVSRLQDPHPWVRYDAAWVVEEAKLKNPAAMKALRKLAAGMRAPLPAEEERLRHEGDAATLSRMRAAQTLKKLGRRPRRQRS